ncbi:hypothetical protein Aperf_G00000041572 [Anoplocephala perfoliata]
MNDIIKELFEKPRCVSLETRRRQNRALALREKCTLREIYKDNFILNALEDVGEFFIESLQKYTVFLSGPPIRRNLKYSDISSFDSSLNQMTYNLTSLPPIYFKFQLGPDYPNDRNFTFWFESAWLPPFYFDFLSCKLSEIIKAQRGSPLQQCCNFLQEDALSSLFSIGEPTILVINAQDAFDNTAERVQFVETLVDYEEEVREMQFALGTYECPVCMDEFKGVDCARVRACGHVFCRGCLARAIEENVHNATNSGSPLCPSCNETVHPVEIRQVVSPEIYELYETMLLNRTLADMPNVVECPAEGCRNAHVMLDDNYMEGICPVCRFHFCAKCRQAIHPDTACVTGPLANLTANEARDLVERYRNAGEQGQQMMEKQHGRLNILKLIDEVASNSFIVSNCKPCPNCKSPIQKYTGCNRVMCTKCQKNFCWICLVAIESSNPYDHFSNKKCPLYRN